MDEKGCLSLKDLPSIQALSKTVWIPMSYMCGPERNGDPYESYDPLKDPIASLVSFRIKNLGMFRFIV